MRNMSGSGMDYVLSGAGGAALYLYSSENDAYMRQVTQ
jgi:hypothetical protein